MQPYQHVPCSPECREHEPDKHFKIECVIVCDKYADFLRHTLPNNRWFFDYTVVVTSPDDLDTRRICEFYHVHCVTTDRIKSAEGKFCKGAAINEGLKILRKDGWVLHLDADIWLPPLTRELLQWANLDRRMLYGIDRFDVRGFRAWQEYLAMPALQHECGAYIHLANHLHKMGTRFMQRHMGGYTPIGFFQLWNPKVSGVTEYPEGGIWAGSEDLLFANKWKRSERSFIPELIGYHLESEDAGFGTNWQGRKTKPFAMPEETHE